MDAVMPLPACDGGSERHLHRYESDVAAVQLKKILEWELSLDARDLRSHAWYHGAISRSNAEQIVGEQDGDFLVRDCTSQPGNYVLSCRSRGQNLHFVINKIVLQPNTVYESVQYRFEDDGFDTVPDLITYYVGSGKPVTVASAAKIQKPQNRRHPLSFYDANANTSKYDAQNFETRLSTTTCTCATAAAAAAATAKKQRSFSLRPGDISGIVGLKSIKSIETKQTGSNDSSSPVYRLFSNSLPRPSCFAKIDSPSSITLDMRSAAATASASSSSSSSSNVNADNISGDGPLRCNHCQEYANVKAAATVNGDHENGNGNGYGYGYDYGCDCDVGVAVGTEPPPKPSRVTVRDVFDVSSKDWSLYAATGSDSGNGSDDSVQSCNATVADTQKRTSGVAIKNTKYDDGDNSVASGIAATTAASTTFKCHDSASTCETLSRQRQRDDFFATCTDDHNEISRGMIRMSVRQSSASASAFDLDAFHTILLPSAENKPLDTCALQSVHALLMDSGSRILANHLTRADLELTVRNFTRSPHHYDTIMCKTGIELSVLPQGRRHRLDLIERSECLRILVAVTILTCATELERAELLNKWIEVAIDTKTALGNLFGFCGIMLGLCTPQVQRLNETWHILRQRYTDSAFNFEAKLKPTLKCMNESTNPLAPNTTIPHLLPVILLYEGNYRHISGGGDDDDDNDDDVFMENSHIWDLCINQWEASSTDLGLGTVYSHLNATRQFYNSLPTFRRNAEIVLTDSKIDHLLSDLFRTEFHLKFLWGSRGAKVNAAERYSKFQQVLNIMSEKCETIDYDGVDAVASPGPGPGSGPAFAFPQSADWYSSSTASV